MLPNPQETADLVTFTEENLNGNLYILCSIPIRNFAKLGFDPAPSVLI